MTPATRNVLSVVLGVAAIVGLIVVFGQRPSAHPSTEPSPASAAPVPVAPASTAATPTASDGGGDEERGGLDAGASPATAADAEASAHRARDAAAVWVDHDLTTAEWQAQLQPQVSADAWPQLALPDPQRVTPRKITGDLTPVTVTATAATYNVPTDAGALSVTVIRKGEGTWVVSNIAKDL